MESETNPPTVYATNSVVDWITCIHITSHMNTYTALYSLPSLSLSHIELLPSYQVFQFSGGDKLGGGSELGFGSGGDKKFVNVGGLVQECQYLSGGKHLSLTISAPLLKSF